MEMIIRTALDSSRRYAKFMRLTHDYFLIQLLFSVSAESLVLKNMSVSVLIQLQLIQLPKSHLHAGKLTEAYTHA